MISYYSHKKSYFGKHSVIKFHVKNGWVNYTDGVVRNFGVFVQSTDNNLTVCAAFQHKTHDSSLMGGTRDRTQSWLS